jgi:hypothetical protein
MASLSGFGATPTNEMGVIQILQSMADGTVREQLLDWKTKATAQVAEANAQIKAAQGLADQSAAAPIIKTLQAVRNSAMDSLQQWTASCNKHDLVASELGKYGISIPLVGQSSSNLGGLSGLSAFGNPIAIPSYVIYLVVAGATIAVLVTAVALSISVAGETITGNDGVLTQMRKLLESMGALIATTTGSIVTLAFVAAGGFLLWQGYKWYKGRKKP